MWIFAIYSEINSIYKLMLRWDIGIQIEKKSRVSVYALALMKDKQPKTDNEATSC